MEDYIFYTFLFLWFTSTLIINFFPKKNQILNIRKKHVVLTLFINEWRVFSPNPIKTDIRFYYRDLKKNGSTTKLKEIELFSLRSNPFFNTSHRERLFLNRVLVMTDPKKSTPYSLFKKYIRTLDCNEEIVSRQICMIITYGFYPRSEDTIKLIDYIEW